VSRHQLQVLADADAVARRGAELIAEASRASARERGHFAMAASGGREPWVMFGRLEDHDIPWQLTEIFQADERIAPAGSDERNLTHLIASLSIGAQGSLKPMPVDDDDLEAAAARYAEQIPESFDLIHLGIGPDGHTCSLVPGDPVLEVTDRDVALTRGEYQGTRRMTITYPVLSRARRLLWLITGEEKRDALGKLLHGDRSTPSGRVEPGGESLILADEDAAG
jgi:6-phosphogluconolactonase